MKILHKKCLHCKSPFQTWEKDMVFCNSTCEAKHKVCSKTTPKEEDPSYVPISEDRNKSSRLDRFRQCNHCGRMVEVTKHNRWRGRTYAYCTEFCYSARVIYKDEKKLHKTCFECEKSFIGMGGYCSEECRYSSRKTKRVTDYIETRKNAPKKNRAIGKRVSYEELNRREEKKRLRHD